MKNIEPEIINSVNKIDLIIEQQFKDSQKIEDNEANNKTKKSFKKKDEKPKSEFKIESQPLKKVCLITIGDQYLIKSLNLIK